MRLTAMPQLLVSAAIAMTGLQALANPSEGWGYQNNHNGPSKWMDLAPEFEACGNGMNQSPIDIQETELADLPPLHFNYGVVQPTLINNGHTIQLNLPSGQTLQIGDTPYELLQLHFHTPSEMSIVGKRADMSIHFVHQDPGGALGVVAVFMQTGKPNPTIASIFARLPHTGETITVNDLAVDLAALLPAEKGYYTLEGSLTTPPCSEGVNWIVMKHTISISADQLKQFKQLFPSNARPIQPTNGRIIKESR